MHGENPFQRNSHFTRGVALVVVRRGRVDRVDGPVIRSVLNRTLEITHAGMLGGLHGLQCGTIAGLAGIVYALADSAA